MNADSGVPQDPGSSLPVHRVTTPVSPFPAAAPEAFWAGIEEWTAQGDMSRLLDDLMDGQVAPRVWLLLHPAGLGHLSAVAALGLTRELAARGQVAYVLDCDEQDQALTRWAGRHEQEGWIDFARFGVSPHVSAQAIPLPGRTSRFLGLGSFSPTDVTPQEIENMIARLRHQADDLILVASLGPEAGPWSEIAALRMLCCEEGRPAPIPGATEYGSVSWQRLISFPAAATTEDSGSVPVAKTAEPVPAPTTPVPLGSGTRPEVPAAAAVPEPDIPAAVRKKRRRSSGVFWIAGLVVIALIAVVGIYYLKFVGVPPIKESSQVAELGDGQTQSGPTTNDLAADERPVVDRADRPLGETDSLIAGGFEPETDLASADPGSIPAMVPADLDTSRQEISGGLPDSPGGTGAPAETDSFSMVPFEVEVGAAGWALHVYSLADSAGTARQVADLERRGFQSAVREIQKDDGSNWYRIYLGSFASRAEAADHLPGLLAELRQDWGRPTRF